MTETWKCLACGLVGDDDEPSEQGRLLTGRQFFCDHPIRVPHPEPRDLTPPESR